MSMTWLFPAGAVAAIAIVAIVVLHMRHRMPGVVPFPQLAFWPRVPSESRESPRWRKPPMTLLFLLQLLAALLLVLAFMRPALPGLGAFGGQRTTSVQHVIVLDGSTSMLAESPNGGTRWDAAKREIGDALDAWQQGDGVTLIVAAAQPAWKSAADEQQVGELDQWVENLELPGGVPDDQAVSRLLSDVALPELEQRITLITDGGLELPDDGANVDRVRVGDDAEQTGNVAITSTTVSPAEDGERQIEATVLRDAAGTQTLPWVATSGSSDIDSGTITVGSNEVAQIGVRVPDRVDTVWLEIVADDALAADNRATVSLQGDQLTGLRVVLISDVPSPTQRALEVLPGAVVETYPSTTPGISDVAANADLVVYESSAPAEDDMPTTPILLIQPTGLDESWQIGGVAPNPSVTDVQLDDPVMRDISLDGVVFGETPVYQLGPGAEVLASGADVETQVPLVWRGSLGGQPYVAYAFDPTLSNIAARVTFPVLVAQTVASLAGQGSEGVHAPGDAVPLDVPENADSVSVTTPDGAAFGVPAVGAGDGPRTATFTVTAQPGVWTLSVLDDAGSELERGRITVNVGSVQESRLNTGEPIQLRFASASTGASLTGTDEAQTFSDIWPLLVLGAIVVIGLEWLVWLARSVSGRVAGGARSS